MCRNRRVAQVHDDALADVGHQIARHVRADALEEIRDEDERRDHRAHASARCSTSSKIGLMTARAASPASTTIAGDRCDQPAAIRRRVAKQPEEFVHSVNRYLSSTQSATTPSRHVIFFPSSYPRPS